MLCSSKFILHSSLCIFAKTRSIQIKARYLALEIRPGLHAVVSLARSNQSEFVGVASIAHDASLASSRRERGLINEIGRQSWVTSRGQRSSDLRTIEPSREGRNRLLQCRATSKDTMTGVCPPCCDKEVINESATPYARRP